MFDDVRACLMFNDVRSWADIQHDEYQRNVRSFNKMTKKRL